MRKFKQRWNKELDKIVPSLSKEVLSAPIAVSKESAEDEEEIWQRKRVKRFAFSAMCAVLALVFSLSLVSHFTTATPNLFEGGYAMVVEVNPKVMFTVNGKGKVVTVSALNNQADVILSNSERVSTLKGKTAAESLKLFINYTAMLGYIDIGGEDAIKISHSAGNKFSLVENEIENFFKEKGYFTVIFTKRVSVNEIALMLGESDIKSVVRLSDRMNSLPILYSERKVKDKTLEEIQDIYQEEIILGDMREFIKTQIDIGFKSGDRLKEIYNLNRQIASHELNPFVVLGLEIGDDTSYWALKSYPEMDKLLEKERYAEFKAFMDKMDGLLTEYERDYGIKLNLKVLYSAYNLYCSGEGEVLRGILEKDESFYLASLPLIQRILPDISYGIDFGNDFYYLPNSETEFVSKTESIFDDLFGAYFGKNYSVYREVRQPISDSEYSNFLQTKIEKYGSIEKYWESLQKNDNYFESVQ